MMVMLTKDAETDLEEIADFIRPHNPERAESFINELLDCCESLSSMPFAFPLEYRYENLGIRRYAYHTVCRCRP